MRSSCSWSCRWRPRPCVVAGPRVVGGRGRREPTCRRGTAGRRRVSRGCRRRRRCSRSGRPPRRLWIRYRRGDPDRAPAAQVAARRGGAGRRSFLPTAFILPDQDIANVAFILGALTLVALPGRDRGRRSCATGCTRSTGSSAGRIAYAIVTVVLLGVFGVAVVLSRLRSRRSRAARRSRWPVSTLVAYRPVPARPAARQPGRRPPLRPGPLRRRADGRGLRRAASRRDRHRDPDGGPGCDGPGIRPPDGPGALAPMMPQGHPVRAAATRHPLRLTRAREQGFVTISGQPSDTVTPR